MQASYKKLDELIPKVLKQHKKKLPPSKTFSLEAVQYCRLLREKDPFYYFDFLQVNSELRALIWSTSENQRNIAKYADVVVCYIRGENQSMQAWETFQQ